MLGIWRACPRLVVATVALVLALSATSLIALTADGQTFLGLEPVTGIVAAGMVAGFAFMLLPGALPYLQSRAGSLYWIVGIGLALRLVMMIPEPILEIDYFRYLWDGAVIQAGFSPYEWSPGRVLAGAAPDALSRLARTAPEIIGRINYPDLTTIYPPVAEFVFAVTSWIKPWDLMVWRLVILAFEVVTVGLLYALLTQLGRPPLWIIIYWWNPVVIIQFSNAAHMDAILLPALIGAALLALKNRRSLAAVGCLAMATAVKLWPVLLLPTLIRSASRPFVAAAVFTIASTALLWPFIDQAFQMDAGLRAYGVSWERNGALFHLTLGGLRTALDSYGLFDLDAGRILRAAVAAVVILIALGINRRPATDGEMMIRRLIIVMAALLLLGPTMYPWYYTWMVPFLAIVPNVGLLALSVVLPLYYMQFHPWIQANPWVFTEVVVWFEQGPVFILLFLGWRHARR